MTWLVMQRSVWNDIVSWQTRRLSNSTKYLLHASMTTTSKEEETKSVGELLNTCSQIVLKCLYLARIGRPDILWSVNKLARSITKWTKACDKRFQIHIWRNIMCFRKPYICSSKLDVQETNCRSFLTAEQNLKSSLWTLD